jgi:protein-arginine kinase activator protein McsA
MICKNCENNKFLVITQTIEKGNINERSYECNQCNNKFKTIKVEENKLPPNFIKIIEILSRLQNRCSIETLLCKIKYQQGFYFLKILLNYKNIKITN